MGPSPPRRSSNRTCGFPASNVRNQHLMVYVLKFVMLWRRSKGPE